MRLLPSSAPPAGGWTMPKPVDGQGMAYCENKACRQMRLCQNYRGLDLCVVKCWRRRRRIHADDLAGKKRNAEKGRALG